MSPVWRGSMMRKTRTVTTAALTAVAGPAAADTDGGAHWPVVLMCVMLLVGVVLALALRSRRHRRRHRFDLWLLSRPESRVLRWRPPASIDPDPNTAGSLRNR